MPIDSDAKNRARASCADVPPGRRVGDLLGTRYRIDARLGHGATSAIYRVVDVQTGALHAAKCLNLATGDRDAAVARFRREHHTLRHLAHPHIVEARDYHEDRVGPFFTLALLDGADLSTIHTLPWREVCRVGRDLASALAYLHARRLLHRDVSPRNVHRGRSGASTLIDLGAVVTVGVAPEVIGTPPCMTPEALHGQVLDPRTDLFGLGALIYRLLTGVHARPARHLNDLPEAWRRPVAAPSTLASAPSTSAPLPAALDALVLSLLALDRDQRPRHAAEVAERLGAIAGLPSSPAPEIARAYLSTPRLVERTEAQRVLQQHIRAARAGASACVCLEGPPGVGRSRMLDELALDAEQLGAKVHRVDAGRVRPAALGVVRALLDAAGGPQDVDTSALSGPVAMERRLRAIASLRTVLARQLVSGPVVLAIDDARTADDSSLSCLAELIRDPAYGGLLVVPATHRSGSCTTAWKALSRRATHLALEPLTAAGTEELVLSLFGDVPDVRRVAGWIHRLAHGLPRETVELARDLVARDLARFVDAGWLLPRELFADPPASLGRLFEDRVRRLAPDALALAEEMSVHRGAFTVSPAMDRIEAVATLVREDVWVGEGDRYAFRQQGLREAVLRGMTAARSCEVHRAAAERGLAEAGVGVERIDVEQSDDGRTRGGRTEGGRFDAGWHLDIARHLMACGEHARGAAFAAEACRDLSALATVGAEAVPVLEQAVAGLPADAEVSVALTLHAALGHCAYAYDRRLVAHADVALDGFARQLRTTSSTPDEGREGASRDSGASPDPWTVLPEFLPLALARCGVAVFEWDLPAIARLHAHLSALSTFDVPLVRVTRALIDVVFDGMRGRDGAAAMHRRALLTTLETPVPGLPDDVRRHIRATQLHAAGMAEIVRGRIDVGRALGDALAREDLRMYDGAVLQVRCLAHLYDGAFDAAAACRRQMEWLALQHDARRQVELWLLRYLVEPHALAGDCLGLRRTADALFRVAEEHPGYLPDAWVAHGAHLRERGDHQEAHDAYRRALALAPCGEHARWLPAMHGVVDTLVRVGRPADAIAFAEDALGAPAIETMDARRIAQHLAPTLADAELAVGRRDAALARIEAALAVATQDAPGALRLGRLHEVAARLATSAAVFRRHRRVAGRCYAGHPGLRPRLEALDAWRARFSGRAVDARTGSGLRPHAKVAHAAPSGDEVETCDDDVTEAAS